MAFSSFATAFSSKSASEETGSEVSAEMRLSDIKEEVCAVHGRGRVGGSAVVRQPLLVGRSAGKLEP